jgi:hypothetical protein
MIDTSGFTSAVRLPEGGKIVPFFYGHIALMNLGPDDLQARANIPDWLDRIKNQTNMGPSFTGLYYGKPMLSFGIIPVWPGLAEAWMIPDENIGAITIPLCRCARQFFAWADTAMQLRRTQIIVRSSNVRAQNWAEFLYFEKESEMTGFGPTGESHFMYRRLNHGRSI